MIADPTPQYWEQIKTRMQDLESALVTGFEPAPETVHHRLRERARLLAQPAPKDTSGERLDVQVFELSGETYAVETRYVDEALPLRQMTTIPCTPNFILGVVNVRGRMVSVVDLRCFFGLPLKGLSDQNHLLVIHSERMEFALLTDRVPGGFRLPRQEIQEPPVNLEGVRKDYLLGVTVRHWTVLDADRLLTDPRLVVEDQA